MPIEQCRNIILLYRLRQRAKSRIAASRRAGNPAVAEIYARIDAWLETQMKYAMSGTGR